MEHVSDETNKYYIFLSQKLAPFLSSRLQSWKNTTPEELYVFFAETMLMARVKKLKNSRIFVQGSPHFYPPIYRLHVQRQLSFTTKITALQ
jgi:hypothetical protein